MLKYKLLIKLFMLSCVLVCCVYGDTIQVEVWWWWWCVSPAFIFSYLMI